MSNPYGAPPPSPPPSSPVNGTLILILGILSIVICCVGVILGPIAIVMGGNGLKTLDQYGDPLNQRGSTNTGRICGIIGTITSALVIIFYVVCFLILGMFGHSASPTYPTP
jgi:hypothetical protein